MVLSLAEVFSRGEDVAKGPSHAAALGVLQSLFAIFMGRSKLKHRKAESMTVQEEEERVVSVISNLLTVRRFLELFRNMNRKPCCMMPPLVSPPAHGAPLL